MANRSSTKEQEWAYIIFLALIAATPPISTDMYLAAIPRIADSWNVGEPVVSLSLILWFVSFSMALLLFGPISDKYGRKPILLSGMALFVLSTFLCAFARNVEQLIGFRILQGFGAAAPSSMCMAICRDRFDAERRKHALAYIGIVLTVAPMASPMIGALLLQWSNWRFIFFVQGIIGMGTFLICLRYEETLREKLQGSLFGVFFRYIALFRNRNYMMANQCMGLLPGPFFGFIAFSSIAYIRIFGLSEKAFSLLFGANALMSMVGAYTCTRLTRYVSDERLIRFCLMGCVAGGAILFLLGNRHFLFFTAGMAAYSYFCGISRPISSNLILEQVDRDIGSASSLVVFYQFLVGAICMALATAQSNRPIRNFGLLVLVVPCIVLFLWPFLIRRLKAKKRCDITNV